MKVRNSKKELSTQDSTIEDITENDVVSVDTVDQDTPTAVVNEDDMQDDVVNEMLGQPLMTESADNESETNSLKVAPYSVITGRSNSYVFSSTVNKPYVDSLLPVLDNTAIVDTVVTATNVIYAVTTNGNIFNYTIGTSNKWTLVASLFPLYTNLKPISVALSADSTMLYIGTVDKLLFAMPITTGVIAKLSYTGYMIEAMTPSGIVANVVLAGESGNVVLYNGTKFTDLASPTTERIMSICSVGTNLYIGTFNGSIFYYNGTTWTNLNLVNSGYRTRVTALVANATTLYVGLASGIVLSYVIATKVWSAINSTSIDNYTINNLFFDAASTPNLYCTTITGNLYELVANVWTKLNTTATGNITGAAITN